MTELANLGGGFVNALQPLNFAMILLGLTIGIVAGALPGITMLNAIVLVLPFTYLMGIVPALLLMIGVYCGGVFGGSITGILFNIPGDPMNVPTTWEGYRLSRQGRTQYALGLAIMSSAFGGLVSALFLAFLAPPFARFALGFSTVEFFAVVVFGLASVSVLGQSSTAAPRRRPSARRRARCRGCRCWICGRCAGRSCGAPPSGSRSGDWRARAPPSRRSSRTGSRSRSPSG